jgi:snapalysin
MSGSSAPVACQNPNPNSQERAQVDAAFRSAVTAVPAVRAFEWIPAA